MDQTQSEREISQSGLSSLLSLSFLLSLFSLFSLCSLSSLLFLLLLCLRLRLNIPHNTQRLSIKEKEQYDKCSSVVSRERSFANYRKLLREVDPPCIPYLGMFLTDLTFIEEGSAAIIYSDVINFGKRQLACDVIRNIQQYQQCPYNLQVVESIRAFFFSQTQQSLNEDDAFNLSLRIEPPQRYPPPTSIPTLNQWEDNNLPGQSNHGATQMIRCYSDESKKLNRVECHGKGYPFNQAGTKALRKVLRQHSEYPNLVAATLEKIVEWMTAENRPGKLIS